MQGRGIVMPKSENTYYDRLKMASYKKGMSLGKLAEKTGINYYTFLAQKRRLSLSCYNLMLICEALDCSADYLLFGKKGINGNKIGGEKEQFEKI